MKTYSYKGEEICFTKAFYDETNTVALLMYTKDDEYYGDATVCLPKNDFLKPHEEDAFIDVYNNEDGFLEWLVEIKAGHPLGISQKNGFNVYPLFRFNVNFLKDIPYDGDVSFE